MRKLLAAVAAWAITASSAQALQTLYFDPASFAADAGALAGFEGFNDVRTPRASFTYPGFTMTMTSQGINAMVTTGHDPSFSAGIVEGSGSVWYDADNFGVITFAFDSLISAFAFFVTTSENVAVQMEGFGLAAFNLTANNPTFFGVINPDQFQSVRFATDPNPLVAFDALQFGIVAPTTVPEPPAWALLVSGLGIFAWSIRASSRRAPSSLA